MERMGAVPQAEAPTTETANVQSPMHFVAPTEFVDLPSKGIGYASTHPMHGKDTIEIRYMTAKDEDLLTSKTLLKKGIALERFLENIIVDKNIKASSLLVGDRNAIVIASRISGYGSDYITKINCPSCGHSSEVTFDLNKTFVNESQVDEKMNLTKTGDGNFSIIMPLSKFTVDFRLLTGEDEAYLTKLITNKAKGSATETALTDQYKRMIVSVQGHADQSVINRFVDNMPTRDSRFFRSCYKIANPDVKVIDQYSCTECGFEQELEVPFGADFFWPE
tara:strand:+ start:439 stop:1272 length:834 start_codon:yes stop_codon:yes gene_type:complete